MTATGRSAGAVRGTAGSLRQALTASWGLLPALVGLLVITEIVHGFRVLGPDWQGGDLLYHSALANAVLRGELPPGGPYEGLPAYYPPGFHAMLAGTMGLLGLDPARADGLLTLAWLPVLPIGTFLLVRRLTGRPWVALLATALTVFGGAYVLSAGRLWVNSLFLNGHEAYPLYPRDIVFALLPFVGWAFLRALDRDRRWPASAAAAGLLLGLCAVVQVQLLLPIPLALAAPALAVAWRDPGRRRQALLALAVAGALSAALVAPWFLGQLAAIRANGGVALDSAETLLPASISFWAFPRQFGLFLPFAAVGVGVALLVLRRPRGPAAEAGAPSAWSPRPVEGPLLLVPWFVLPFALAVLYDPSWPLEDALRPQRLWLLSGQPAAILAAIGLTAAAEWLVAGRWRRPRLVAPALAAALLVAALPSTIATVRLVDATWREATYAHLELEGDRVPDFGALLGRQGPRRTTLTYEDWSSLVWYETGDWVVAVKPPGFGKLAYDPGIFTGRSQAERRADAVRAFRADPEALAAVTATYGADRIVLARRGAAWGWIDQVAAVAAAEHGAVRGATAVVEGNGWDALDLAPGGRLTLAATVEDRPIGLEIRLQGVRQGVPVGARRLRLLAVESDPRDGSSGSAGSPDGGRLLVEVTAPPSGPAEWQVLAADVQLEPGERLALEAVDALAVQSVRGFIEGLAPPAGWRVAAETDRAVLLERSP